MHSSTPTLGDILSGVVGNLTPAENAAFLQTLATRGAQAIARDAGIDNGSGRETNDSAHRFAKESSWNTDPYAQVAAKRLTSADGSGETEEGTQAVAEKDVSIDESAKEVGCANEPAQDTGDDVPNPMVLDTDDDFPNTMVLDTDDDVPNPMALDKDGDVVMIDV
ncbi:hypothetical protein GGTG_13044 [Gaeumannomyces tritici R3-111a-1]|uniref:Uncharacterized protein n=1 Tax=Gaeumannomyces tritici (strain R3-111a-1) TaxID=644352 RepID=J3PHR3_GAET3|nr:hypothetical protein GGTG_13044 [Gaeumannomyces tritici R3-111a-1]EJT69425.1 hypothetical protein GGTG_13044 [Gaeumannomyces tritici R3-111a-1]